MLKRKRSSKGASGMSARASPETGTKKRPKQSHPRLREALRNIARYQATDALKMVIWDLMRTQTEMTKVKERLCRLEKAKVKK